MISQKEVLHKKTRQPNSRYVVINPNDKGVNLMNTMKSFYDSISSVSGPQGPYFEALAKISRINHRQTNTLMSDLGWQEWVEQNQKTATA